MRPHQPARWNTDHCAVCPTRRLCLAAGLDGDALIALESCVRPSRAMRRGDRLYAPGEPADACFVVRSGSYRTIALTADGEERVTGFYFPGDLLGVAGLSAGERDETAEALETSTACRLDPPAVDGCWSLGCGPSLLRMLGEQGSLAREHQMTLSDGRADARVARFLLALADRMRRQRRDDARLPLPMSRTDLAGYLGMTLESLSRTMSRLARSGLIDPARHAVTVLDQAGLRALTGRSAELPSGLSRAAAGR